VCEGQNYLEYEEDDSIIALAATILADIEKALKTKEYLTLEVLVRLLPLELNDIAPLFYKRELDKLLPYRKGIDI